MRSFTVKSFALLGSATTAAHAWVLPTSLNLASGLSSRTELQNQQGNSNDELQEMKGSIVSDKYVLHNGQPSPSGKSSIFTAYEKDNPESGPVVIKFSEDQEALEQEVANFDALDDNLFVEAHDFMDVEECYFDDQNGLRCEPVALENNGALVMERGSGDLKEYLNQNGALKEPQLRKIAWTAVQCLRDMHSKGMVWTDLKSHNLVIIYENDSVYHPENTNVKGIDVESAVPRGNTPLDYTPRGSPPELAIRFLSGTAGEMPVDFPFDIWSLGILLHEMATGQHYFEDEKDHKKVATQLINTGGLNISDVNDLQLRDLIHRCLQIDANLRPTIEQVVQHPYFTQPEVV